MTKQTGMNKEKNIGGIIALVAGIVLVLGSITTLIVIQIRKNKVDNEDAPIIDLDAALSETGSTTGYTNAGFSVEQIKAMQTYLLQIGIQKNNQYIIDAIQLTGGIDGQMGSGFHAAIKEAKDKGYLDGYEDVLRRLGY